MGKLCFSFPYCNNIRFLVHSVQNESDIDPYPWCIPGSFPVLGLHRDEETENQPYLEA